MSREIKFRALMQHEETGRTTWLNYTTFQCEMNMKVPPRWFVTSIRDIQFTGLKDKNGKEIYEGDIIYIGHPHKGRTYTGEIIYEKNRFTAKGFSFAHHDDPSEPFESLEYMEVIGNIYENPNLLEVNS